jgi:hypothetical protein
MLVRIFIRDMPTHLEVAADISHQPQAQKFEPNQPVVPFLVLYFLLQLDFLTTKRVPTSASICRESAEAGVEEVSEVKADNKMLVKKYWAEYVTAQKAFL